MKKCPYCTERIRNKAVKCKYCGSDLTEHIAKEKDKRAKEFKLVLKIVFILFAISIGIWLWYLSIPALIIWFIWKKTKLTKQRKKQISIVVAVLFVIVWIVLIVSNLDFSKVPVITISSPKDNIEVKTDQFEITGTVSPSNSELLIKETGRILQVIDENFAYTVKLDGGKNNFTLVATNNKKRSEVNISITRILTEEERISEQKQREKQKEEREKALIDEKRIQDEKFKAELNKSIKEASSFKGDEYRDNQAFFVVETTAFSVWADQIKKTRLSEDVEIINLGKKLESELKKLQSREFPKMRQAYAKILNTKMWEHNVTVKAYGTGNGTLELTGVVFANNKTIKESHLTLLEMLELLRFDRVNYKWIEYGDYTYFALDSSKDTDILYK